MSMIDEDPIETEQWLALQAYLCFCCAWGAFMGAVHGFQMVGIYFPELFWMGAVLGIIGFVLLALAEFKVPTKVWIYFYRKATR